MDAGIGIGRVRLFALLVGTLLQAACPAPTAGIVPLVKEDTHPSELRGTAGRSSAGQAHGDAHIRAEVNPGGSFVKHGAHDHKAHKHKRHQRVAGRTDVSSSLTEVAASSAADTNPAPGTASDTLGLETAADSQNYVGKRFGEAPEDPDEESANDQDCAWDTWSVWSACSKTCNIGQRIRFRGRTGPLGNGAPCVGLNKQNVNCNFDPCPIHCALSSWIEWTECSKTCGGPSRPGMKMRYRQVKRKAFYGGKECEDNLEEKAICNHRIMDSCPTDCKWAPWSVYGRCSLTCGTFGGVQVRQRAVETQSLNGGALCEGEPYETRECNKKGCPIDCWWLPWQAWEECSATCGEGKRVRIRDMKNVAKFDGICPGEGMMTEACTLAPCPVDCTWTSWGEWGDCSNMCGGGERKKQRSRNQAQNKGKPCVGEAEWAEVCNMNQCNDEV